MAPSDVDVVRAVFDAFARRDVEAVIDLVHADVEFSAVTADVAGRPGPYRGHEGMREYFADVASVWDELRLTPGEFRDLGDHVLITGRVHARSRARIVDGSTGWIFELRDGKVARGRVYGSADEAIRAARQPS